MLYIAGDHYAAELMQEIEKYLDTKGVKYKNFGSRSADAPITLQEIIPEVAERIRNEANSTGILACGTGAGVEIGANRFKGIRACLCTQPEQAKNARIYDNANLLCLGSWLIEDPAQILDAWFANKFDGNEGRTKMLKYFDTWQ